MASERLDVILQLITGNYKREAREAASATGQIGTAAKSASGQVDLFGRATGAVGTKLTGLVTGSLIAAGAGVIKFGADSVKAASNLEESMNAVNVVFGTAAKTITDFGEKAANSAGLAQAEFQEMASVLGSALINAGIPLDEAAAKTIELTQRAADMASVFNTSVPEALGAMQAALRGESDPIEKFGVTLSAAAVDSEAAALGFKKLGGEWTTQAKAAARLSLIMKQTDRVAGDFANTSDGLANSSKVLTANMTNLQAQIGGFLTPALAELSSEALEATSGIAGFIGVIEKLAAELPGVSGGTEDASAAVDKYTGLLDLLIPGLSGTTQQWADLNTQLEANAIASIKAIGAGKEMVEAHDSWTLAAAAYAALGIGPTIVMLDNQAASHRDAAKAADTQRTALINLFSAQADLLDPIRTVLLLQKEAADAQQRLTDAQEDGDTSAIDLALATIEAEQAFLRLQSAGAALTPDQVQAFALVLINDLGMSEQQALDTLAALNLLDGWSGKANFTLEMNTVASGGGGVNPLNDVFGFDSGGVVPGPRGSAQLILAHGGETILPTHKTGSAGGGLQIIVQSPMNDFRSDMQYATILATVTNLVEVQN